MSIASEFELLPLGDLVRFINGDRSTNYPKGNDYVEAGIPFISATDLSNGRIDKSSAKGITRAAYEKLRSGKIQADDVLFCLRGSIGKIAYVREGDAGAIASSLVIVRATEKVNARYLFFVLSSPSVQQAALGLNNGAAQPNVSVGELQKVLIPLPPVPTQRRIASILSAYDDLIENNTRRIAILEEMARRIYEEWFVHFRFPGHEQVKMVESELGLIPEGWSWQSLRDIAMDVRDGVNPESTAPTTPYVGLEHIPRRSIGLTEWGFASEVQSTKLRFQRGDILFGKIRPYFHKVAVAPVAGVASSDAIVIRAKEPKWYSLVLATVSSDAFVAEATQSSNGTKMPRANWNVLLGYKVPQPTEQALERFSEVMSGIVDFIRVATLKNRNLRNTRDLLLPKLISGELDVSNLPTPEEVSAA